MVAIAPETAVMMPLSLINSHTSSMSENTATEKAQHQAKPPPSLFKTFIAGGVGGTCLVLVGHPLDTIKVRGC